MIQNLGGRKFMISLFTVVVSSVLVFLGFLMLLAS